MDPRDKIIRDKSADIPQDPLPLDWPEPVEKGRRGRPLRSRPARYVICPSCANQKVGVEPDNRIRHHWKVLRHGVGVSCPASGQDAAGALPSVS